MKILRQIINAAANVPYITFSIPVKWKMQAMMDVTARSLKEAVDILNRQEYELPPGELVPDSYEIDFDRLEQN